jgi:AIPR protein
VRQAIDDEYDIEFELLTTGEITEAARSDLNAFASRLEETNDLPATLQLVDTEVIQARLVEADALELPTLNHTLVIEPDKTLITTVNDERTILTVLPLTECLRLPGIRDGYLFRKNVRQSLGPTNKVNRGLRDTINGNYVRDFFFYHNGITALCDAAEISHDQKMIEIRNLSVVNGCQSLTTIYGCSERTRSDAAQGACVLFRLYEIPDRAQGDKISINTNSQSAVKPRDLRSNDKIMVGLKRAYEARYSDGCMLTKRGEEKPGDKDAAKTIDVAVLAKMLMAWHCQRPNVSYNEKKLFDEHYKTLFRPAYDPESILTLQTWLNAIDQAWPNLTMNDVLKAGRSYTKYHVLFSVSALISHVNGQPQSVVEPKFTSTAAQHAGDILPLAATCLDNALNSAVTSAQTAGRVFSPQNWAKRLDSVQGQLLVASTLAGVLASIPTGPAIRELVTVPPNAFQARWSAE